MIDRFHEDNMNFFYDKFKQTSTQERLDRLIEALEDFKEYTGL